MTEDICQFANESTPQNVHVPNSIAGLIWWALGKFGPWVAVTIVLGWMAFKGDTRNEENTKALMQAFQSQTEANLKMTEAINRLTDRIERLEK